MNTPMTVDFRYSKDGGHNWSNWRQCSMGSTGDFSLPQLAKLYDLGMGNG